MDVDPGSVPRRPEVRLWFHVLRRQIWDFVLYKDADPDSKEYTYAEDAAGWIWWDGEEDLDEFHRPTFRHICCVLGLDPRDVREATLRLKRNDVARLSKTLRDDDA